MQAPHFNELLLHWHRHHNKRTMPWKGEKDPYKIWLSEIILQQTRVEQGLAYYERFIQQYPTVTQLAEAPAEAVFKLWEGLGYYSRCKNLLQTAKTIVHQYHGQFPANYEALLQLKGVGPYTAAAIASFAFQLPYAVVDGNVFRVLARVFAIDTPIDSTEGKKQFTQLAQQVLHQQHPDWHNQAMMDLGATICKPTLPLCSSCPLLPICKAHQNGTQQQLPVKEKTIQKKKRRFYYFLLEYRNSVYLHKRTRKDIWENLYEPYLIESEEDIVWNTTSIAQWLQEQWNVTAFNTIQISTKEVQQLTHQQITGVMIYIRLQQPIPELKQYEKVPWTGISEKPFPKLIHQLMQQLNLPNK